MQVLVDSYAWLPKDQLTFAQLHLLRKELTIVPVRVVKQEEEPKPIPLFQETATHFGMAREFFYAKRRPAHEVVLNVTAGNRELFQPFGRFAGTLRGEQSMANETMAQYFRSGRLGGIIRAGCGWGKTVSACSLMADLDVPTLVLLHKEFLMNQWRERIETFLPEASIGRVQQDECDYVGRSVVLGMIHSVGTGKYPQEFYDWPGLVLVDECFLGTQRVQTESGATPISQIAVGTRVLNATGMGVVTAAGSRWAPLGDLIEIETKCETFICTVEHPIFTTRGWLPAGQLLVGDEVLTHAFCQQNAEYLRDLPEAEFGSSRASVLFSRVHGRIKAAHDAAMSYLRDPYAERTVDNLLAELRSEATCGMAANSRGESEVLGADDHAESGRSGGAVAGAHEGAQSDANRGGTEEGFRDSSRHRASTERAGWQWTWAHEAAGDAAGSAWRRMGERVRRAYGQSKAVGVALHARLGAVVAEVRGRGRRGQSPSRGGPRARSETGRYPGSARVARVAPVERERVEQLGGELDDRGQVRVWNLSVDGHPSYVLEGGTLVHNCHRVGAYTWAPVPARFRSRYRVGYTATPRRKDGADNAFFYHIGPVVFAGKEQRLKFQVKRVWTKFKLIKTDKFNPTLAPRTLIVTFLCASEFRNRIIVEQIVAALQKGRKLLVLSERLQHLERLKMFLGSMWPKEYGAPPTCDFYVGGRSEEALEIAARAQVIFATSQFASEGLDIPAIDTLLLTTPLSDVEQAVGRILRPHEGKKEPIVVDFRDDAVGILEKMAKKRDDYYSRTS